VTGTWRLRVGGDMAAMEAHNRVWLSVSRGIGDLPLKRPATLVSSDPDVFFNDTSTSAATTTQQQQQHHHASSGGASATASGAQQLKLLILACDGVYDALTSQQVVEAALEGLATSGRMRDAADSVVKAAYRARSEDNLTAVVVKLNADIPEGMATMCAAVEQLAGVREMSLNGRMRAKQQQQQQQQQQQHRPGMAVPLALPLRPPSDNDGGGGDGDGGSRDAPHPPELDNMFFDG